ncbi:hypothetical protein JHK82_039692 [Glycine max]|nr:hypothetical protein JHK86_039886 [Glycine max]KAG4965491.1 hypothetical protein JHK85_040466 [Glycine max]KAG5110469.1 hypothetical protein JHK82_039692 [Glycine max]KAG5121757.1 hypothetical protein JHK84_040097 [Glycine max]
MVLLDGRTGFVEVRLYGDMVLRYVSFKDVGPQAPHADPSRWFLLGFKASASSSSFPELDHGIRQLDHAIGIRGLAVTG